MKRLALLFGTLVSASSLACPPPPPAPPKETGEDERAYDARMQRRADEAAVKFKVDTARRQTLAWDFNSRVFVGRIEQVRPIRLSFGRIGQSVRVKPVRWLKGAGTGTRAPFWLTYKGDTDCGPYGGGDAVDGKVGERFVIFAEAGQLSSSAVQDSVSVENALDTRIIDALSESEL